MIHIVVNITTMLMLVFFVCSTFTHTMVSGMSKKDAIEDEELRNQLETALNQKRQLNKSITLISTGLEAMCRTLLASSCSCQNNSQSATKPNEEHIKYPLQQDTPQENPVSETDATESEITQYDILSIESVGVVDDSVTVEVQYMAPKDHIARWWLTNYNGSFFSIAGKSITVTGMSYGQPSIFTNQITIPDYNALQNIAFYVSIDNDNKTYKEMYLNKDALSEKGREEISKTHNFISGLDDEYVAILGNDLNITVTIKDNTKDTNNESSSSEEKEVNVHVSFLGLKQSSEILKWPTFEIVQDFASRNTGSLNVTTFRCGNDKCMSIDLASSYTAFGGVLYITASKYYGQDGLIQRIDQRYEAYILDPINNEVFPYPSISMLPVSNRTLVSSTGKSFMCASIGNPRPSVTILKLGSGEYNEVPSVTAKISKFMVVRVITISPSDVKESNAKYKCLASNDFYTENQTTEAIFLTPVTFDDTMTKVIQNTSNEIVVSCKASGSPPPMLQMRLFDRYGPNVANSEGCKVHVDSPSDTTSILTLTISPVDYRLRTVYCVDTERYNMDSGRTIELYDDLNFPRKD